MKKYLFLVGIILIFLIINSCNDSKTKHTSTQNNIITNISKRNSEKVSPKNEQRKTVSDFLPKGYVIFEKIYGDLNKDGIEDCVIIIKDTKKSKIIKDENSSELDRNRRGIIVLFNKKDHYELAAKNYDCFSSENEYGGVYFPPELNVEIVKDNLYINYSHGRYGYWIYTFRFQNSDFELIGYNDSSNKGSLVISEISMNFLTKKKFEKVIVNENAESGDEVFEETWKKINVNKLIKLSEIKDFDVFKISE